MVSKIQPLYPQGKSTWYPLGRRLGEPQSWSGHNGEEKKIPHCPYRESDPHCPAHSLVSMLTELPWLP